MCVAEKYQKFVQLELSQQLDQPVDSESGQQALIKYQVEQLGLHMQVVLTLIPQEVIDNYTVMSPTAQPHDADSPDHGSPNQGGRRQQLDNKLLMVSHDESKNKEKNVQNKNDRQSRLQRRQEAKESKEKAAKTVKPTTAASKQTTAAGRKGVKHRGASGRGKKHDDDLDDDIKQRKGGHAAKDDDESDEDGEDVEGKTYTDEGEETEEQVDEQDMEDAQDSDDEADQASPSEGRRDNNLTDRAK